MTRAPFAQVVGASAKWVKNAPRALNRRLGYVAEEARWLRLLRILVRDVGVVLNNASSLAEVDLANPLENSGLVLAEGGNGNVALTLDLRRLHSGLAAALSSGLHLGGERRSGRPKMGERRRDPIGDAIRHGVDLTFLTRGFRRSLAKRLARLDTSEALLRAIQPV